MTNENDKSFSVKVDFERILQTIAARIYDTEHAFLRENVQNAIDAIRIQALRDQQTSDNPDYRIDILIKNNTCSIIDNGIGMNRAGLEQNFWTMGASGKNNDEARKAGCIGTFGIGGFANFGVCETLEVISKTNSCESAHKTSLSKESFSNNQGGLPKVSYVESHEVKERGTIVKGYREAGFDKQQLISYIEEYIQYVREPVYIDDQLISNKSIKKQKEKEQKTVLELKKYDKDGFSLEVEVTADESDTLVVYISDIIINEVSNPCEAVLKLNSGVIDIFKQGFRICPVNISSTIGASGYFDSNIFQPTAGRDSLNDTSLSRLTKIIRAIEEIVSPAILTDSNLLANHIRMLPSFVNQGKLDQLGLLKVSTIDGQSYALGELKKLSQEGKRVFYTNSAAKTAASEVLTARGHVIIKISVGQQRRQAEQTYLTRICGAERFDDLLECLEIYDELDRFEKTIVSELDYVIRKLFNPPSYKFVTGKLSLDAPIYWSNKKESGKTIVFLDTRHGEFQKLKPLGYSSLLTSLIEAFCREYLSDTLKRQSTKFFGTGSVNFDSYSKSHIELWELLPSDIEISTINPLNKNAKPNYRGSGASISVMRSSDITQVTITQDEGVKEEISEEKEFANTITKSSPKILRIIDETKNTGLEGYYIKLPQTATNAFGDLLKTFPSFVVLWFANRVTWQVSDLQSSAFLFDITLDRIITTTNDGKLSHGSEELSTMKIHSYSDSLYLFVPSSIVDFIVPKDNGSPIKLQIRHELVDIEGARSWAAREELVTE
ncbi:ATP-binding protein [Nitrosomonas sp.]|uniref:ATP-binding protein n=1 Tax=Nitrosomonas sp. TaxID=42353 RepID=UPI0025DC21CE|nr:ATP-binding protein [Nitrosomonas sp.]